MYEYTDQQKDRIRGMIEAFEGARQHLATSSESGKGICYALYLWVNDSVGERNPAAEDAQNLIARALRPHAYLEGWQNAGFVLDGSLRRKSAAALQLRHRWLDQLVADCKAAL